MKDDKKIEVNEKFDEIDNFCEECKKEDESVSQNLILTGFKTCNSCKLSKTIFPIQLIVDEQLPKSWLIKNKNKIIIGPKTTNDALK